MIPAFDLESGNLPPGIHQATWREITARFGHTPRRRILLAGLRKALLALQSVGCRRAYVDGSFVTAKTHPGDFDGCWEIEGVDVDALDAVAPALLDFAERRKAQKAAYGGEMFPARSGADPSGMAFIDFFQRDKVTGEPKGIIAIDLENFT
jgi:hypothetical protein